jgi:pilus assembly protein FimV
MASVKREQILQEAEKLAARGKLDAAIKEYRRAADQAPNDTNTLNRLGDLLQRVGRVAEAIDVYQKIAEHFAEDGFFLKSIAIYKKVNRLDPQRTGTYEHLADLYFKQGLVVEGRQQLLTLADWFLRSKQPTEAIRVYRRLVELEPANFQARAKLVDLLVQVGDAAAVGVEIEALGNSLLQRGMLDEAVKLYHRALDLGPPQVEFIAPCIDSLVGAGRQTQAVELARKAIESGKAGIELRRAAARAAAEAGDLRTARKLLEGLVGQVGDRTDIMQLYGDVMLRVGETEDAKEILLPVMDRLIRAGDVARTAALVKKLLHGSPRDAAVLERAVKVFDRGTDAEMVLSIESALADAYAHDGRRQEASALYRRLAREHPGNSTFAQRLVEMGGTAAPAAVGPGPEAAAPEPAAVATPPPPAEADVEFVDVEFDGEAAIETGAPPTHPAGVETAPPAPTAAAVAVSPTNAEELFTEAAVFAKYGLTDKAIGHLHRLLELAPTHVQGRELLRSLGGGEMREVQFAELAAPAPASAGEGQEAAVAGSGGIAAEAGIGDVSPLAAATEPPIAAAEAPAAEEPPGVAAGAGEEIPAIEIPIPAAVEPVPPPDAGPVAGLPEPPVVHAAIRSSVGPVRLDDLESMLGLGGAAVERKIDRPATPAFEFDLAGLGLAKPAAKAPRPTAREPQAPQPLPEAMSPPAPAPAAEEAPVAEQPLELIEVSGVLGGPSEDQLRELDFFIQQGLLEDAATLLAKLREAFADHPEVVARHALLKARGWEGEATAASASAAELFSEEEQFFDLAAELEKELAEEDLVAEATGAGKGEDVSIEDLFKEFQKGVAEQVQEGDYDTHFNLGLAYREMGLLDEAIGEFQLSSKSADYLVESASMVGACYVEKGLPSQAVEWYERALNAPNLSSEIEVGLRYELGRAHEAGGDVSLALARYTEVLAVNPAYRDVADRITRLHTN